jgi:hypothetical protein
MKKTISPRNTRFAEARAPFERIVMRGGGRSDGFSGLIDPGPQNPEWKPRGLWYGIDDAWLSWCESEQPNWIGKSFWKLDVDESKMLLLSPGDLEGFTKEYLTAPSWAGMRPKEYALLKKLSSATDWIDWPRVAKRYSGIEIKPYSWKHRMSLMWYYGWDCASGCIWRADALRGFEPVAGPRRREDSK